MTKMPDLTPAQKVKWCKTVLYRASIRAATRYRRWRREAVSLNAEITEGEELVDSLPSESAAREFEYAEMRLAMTH